MKKEETTKRKGSTSRAIKSLNGVAETLKDLKMATPEELAQLQEIRSKIVKRWLSIEMGITSESGETTK